MATMTRKIELDQITAIVDTREQQPYDLAPMAAEAGTLQVGDYSVAGLQSVIAIERKELSDFIACCGRERDRFQRELNSLRGWPVSAVLIETTWQTLELGQWRSRITPASVMGSVTSWIAQGHNLILADDRDMSQRICRSILFHAARHRWREVATLVDSVAERKSA